MIGVWIAAVEGESRTRTLLINDIRKMSEGIFTIEGKWGWTDTNGSYVQVKLKENEGRRRELSLTTGSGSEISVTEISSNLFEGRITNTNYNKKITITREATARNLGLTLEKPNADVPASCSVFFGAWKGRWGQGGIPEQLIHVVKVTPECKVDFFYYADTKYGTNYPGSAEVKDGSISFLCNKETNGTCTFTVKGDELWANYSNPGGGSNSGVFKKQQ
jgi:hypothetical protein